MFNALQGIQINKQTGDKCCCSCCCFLLPHIVVVVAVVSLGGGSDSGSEIPTRVCLPNNNKEAERRAGKKRDPISHTTCILSFGFHLILFYFLRLFLLIFEKPTHCGCHPWGSSPSILSPFHTAAAAAAAPLGRPTPTYSFCYLCQRTCSGVASLLCPIPPAPPSPLAPPPTMLSVFCSVFLCICSSALTFEAIKCFHKNSILHQRQRNPPHTLFPSRPFSRSLSPNLLSCWQGMGVGEVTCVLDLPLSFVL